MTERKLGLALTLAIVLEAIEILRRTPRWLLLLAALALYTVVYLIAQHPFWALGLFALVLVGRRIVRPQP